MSPFYTPQHEAFRQTLRRFVAREIEPFANQWDEDGDFPRELYKAAEIGYMQLGYPEHTAGSNATASCASSPCRRWPAAARAASAASLFTHSALRRSCSRPGSDEGARAAANPVGREDLGARHHRAFRRLRRGQLERARGATAIISSSMARRCSSPAACVRITSRRPCAPAARRERHEPRCSSRATRGPSAHALKKKGWWSSDTAAIYFERCACRPKISSAGRTRVFSASCSISTASGWAWRGWRERFRARVPGGSDQMGPGAQDVRQAARRSSGDPPQDRGDGERINASPAISKCDVAARARRRPSRRDLHAESAGDDDARVLRLRGRCRSSAAPASCAASRSSASIARCASTPSAAARKKSCGICRRQMGL